MFRHTNNLLYECLSYLKAKRRFLCFCQLRNFLSFFIPHKLSSLVCNQTNVKQKGTLTLYSFDLLKKDFLVLIEEKIKTNKGQYNTTQKAGYTYNNNLRSSGWGPTSSQRSSSSPWGQSWTLLQWADWGMHCPFRQLHWSGVHLISFLELLERIENHHFEHLS